mmetsp:Transcript_7195/g.20279  ORF Transcript_7195/g.20279 Transcript_7195/m.20279 type:complete len:703 (+) Transcript_7195:45-2153(+)
MAGSTNFLNVVYHTLTLKALEALFCGRLPDGSQYVMAGPQVMCWEGVHILYVALSTIGLIIYTIGVPVLFFMVLRYARIHDLMRHDRFMKQWGWLYLRYEKEYYFWEIIIMVRRGLLVAVLVTFQMVPSLQAVMGIALVAGLITSHFYARPFISGSLDKLETFGLVSLMGLLCTGSLFYDTYGPQIFRNWDAVVTVMCFLLLFGCMFMVMIMVVTDVMHGETLNRIERKLRKIAGLVITESSGTSLKGEVDNATGPPTVLRMMTRTASSLLEMVRIQSRTPATADGRRKVEEADSSLRSAEQLQKDLDSETLELAKTLEHSAVHRWLNVLEAGQSQTAESSKKPDVENSGRSMMKAMQSLLGRTSECSNSQRSAALRFWLCNHRTKDVMADNSPLSYYSTNTYATFFGTLVHQNPYLLDYLLRASDGQLELAKTVFRDMRDAQTSFSRDGQLATLVSDVDKGPLLAWLLLSDWATISHLRELLVEIYEGAHGVGSLEKSKDNRAPIMKVLDSFLTGHIPKPPRLGFSNPRASGQSVPSDSSASMVRTQALLEAGVVAAWQHPSSPPSSLSKVQEQQSMTDPHSEDAEHSLQLPKKKGVDMSSQEDEVVRSSSETERREAGIGFEEPETEEGQKLLGAGRRKPPHPSSQPSRRKVRQLEKMVKKHQQQLKQMFEFDAQVQALANQNTPFARALVRLIEQVNPN